MTTKENKRDCKHGQLARSCNICELEAEVAQQAERDKANTLLRQALEAVEANHKHHQDYDDYGGYPESELAEQNNGTIAAIKTHLGE